MSGEHDVQRVGNGHVVAQRPRFGQHRQDLRSMPWSFE
jgi:hypothetical protein